MEKNKNFNRMRSSLRTLVQGSLKRITGTITRNGYQSGAFFLNRITKPLIGTTRYNMRAYIKFYKFLYHLYKSGGFPFIVKYLKTSSVLLQQAVAGARHPGQPLGAAVATTSTGIPRIIPRELRARIRSRDRKVIQAWLTIFNLYRILEIPGKLKLSTITSPGRDIDLQRVAGFGEIFFQHLLRINKPLGEFYMNLKSTKSSLFAKPFLIAKSSGTTRYNTLLKQRVWDKVMSAWQYKNSVFSWNFSSTSPISVSIAAVLLRRDTVLWPLMKEWCEVTLNTKFLDFLTKVSDSFDTESTTPTDSWMKVRWSPKDLWGAGDWSLGKLGFKDEPAGKVRVFAMVDCWTQWLLNPLHKSLFSILAAIPQDGTFNQHAPVRLLLDRVVRNKLHDLYSFDLSAATDRLPVSVQEVLLGLVIGPRLAQLWRGLLTWRSYRASSKKYNLDTSVHYAVGQPMGALSSWAMLAFTHHFVVQWSAYLARKDKTLPFSWFELYAVLGDDVVIGDKDVASEYTKLMEWLGVEVSLAKSLVSNKRVCEFAKTFWIPENSTPLPFKEFLTIEKNSGSLMEFAQKHEFTLPEIFHLLGYGYKTKSSLFTKKLSKMGSRVRRILIMLTSPAGIFAKDLRSWLTMESLTKSVDTNQWDRIVHSFVATEFPILIQRLKSLQHSLGIIIAGDPAPEKADHAAELVHSDEFRVELEMAIRKAKRKSFMMRTLPRVIGGVPREQSDVYLMMVEKIRQRLETAWFDAGKLFLVSKDLGAADANPDQIAPKKGVEPALFLLDKSYRISVEDMERYGFKGDRGSFLLLMYQELYSGESRKHFVEVGKLLIEVDRLFNLLSSPTNWHELSTTFSPEKIDAYAVAELVWKRLEELEADINDIPSFNSIVRRQELKGYFDPAISQSKLWLRVRRLAK